MKAGPGTVVTVTYELKTSAGQRIDSTDGVGKLSLLFKQAQRIPGLAAALKGMVPGQTFDLNLGAVQAFGERNADQLESFHRSQFATGEKLKVGGLMVIRRKDPDILASAMVTAIDGDEITLDFHHPMAGQGLSLSGTLHHVRRARSSELSGQFQPYIEQEGGDEEGLADSSLDEDVDGGPSLAAAEVLEDGSEAEKAEPIPDNVKPLKPLSVVQDPEDD